MTKGKNSARENTDAAQASNLLATVAATLDERLAVTAKELARSQSMLREASEELTTAFRGAADRIVAARRQGAADGVEKGADYDVVLDHLYRAVHHLQSHDLVNQLINTQKLRVDKMRSKLREALSLADSPVSGPDRAEQWAGRSRAMLDCIIAGIAQIDDEAPAARSDAKSAGSVDLF